MPLLTREQIAGQFLDGAEKHFDAEITRLRGDVDNLLANSVGIDDHQRIDNALMDLFTKLAAEEDQLETVRAYRKSRGL